MQVVKIDDGRPQLEQLRRIQLKELAVKKGLPANDDMTKDQLIALLAPVIQGLPTGSFAPAGPTITDALKTASDEMERVKALPLFALRKFAKEAGIEVSNSESKADILAKLGIE